MKFKKHSASLKKRKILVNPGRKKRNVNRAPSNPRPPGLSHRMMLYWQRQTQKIQVRLAFSYYLQLQCTVLTALWDPILRLPSMKRLLDGVTLSILLHLTYRICPNICAVPNRHAGSPETTCHICKGQIHNKCLINHQKIVRNKKRKEHEKQKQ